MSPGVDDLWPGVRFTPTERELLVYLLAASGQPVPQDELLRNVWGYHPTSRTRTVSTTVRRLRNKIEPDPGRPERLVFLRGRGYALRTPPRPRGSPSAPSHRLGPDRRFVGRRQELADLGALITQGHRLIAVTGPGGVGKTTLARQLRTSLSARFREVWICDLSGAGSAVTALHTIATAVGVEHAPRGWARLEDQLALLVRSVGPALLVLDNFEQLGLDAGLAVTELLSEAPALQVVLTSRKRPGLPGERILSLAPMTPEDSLALLRDRLEARGGPAGTVDGLRQLAALLEHIPLALEMAVSRAHLMPLPVLLHRLRADLRELRFEGRGDLARHRSLEATVAWSWRLLSPTDRSALRTLTVFRGSFRLEAAESVLGGEGAFASVASLLDHAMLRVQKTRFGQRLVLYEAVRAFVRDQGPLPPGTQQRFLAWVQAHGALWNQDFHRDPGAADALQAELAHLTHAQEILMSTGDRAAVALLTPMTTLRAARGVPEDLGERAQRLRSAGGLSPGDDARVSHARGWALFAAGDLAGAEAEVTSGLRRAGAHSLVACELWGLRWLIAHARARAPEALADAERAEAIAAALERPQLRAVQMFRMAISHQSAGELEQAAAILREAIALCEQHGFWGTAALGYSNLAANLGLQGQTDEAPLALLRRAEELAESLGEEGLLYSVRGNIATWYVRAGQLKEADRRYTTQIEEDGRFGFRGPPGVTHTNAGLVALMCGDHLRAARYFAQARDRLDRFAEGGGGPARIMVRAYRFLALVLAERVEEARQAHEDILPPPGPTYWRTAPEEHALCCAAVALLGGDRSALAARVQQTSAPESPAAAALRSALSLQ